MTINKMNINLTCYTACEYAVKAVALIKCYMNCLIDCRELERCLNNLLFPIAYDNYCNTYDEFIQTMKDEYGFEFDIYMKVIQETY